MSRDPGNHVADAARRSAERDKMSAENPELSLSYRLGQIGILGWAVVVPMLLGVLLVAWPTASSKAEYFSPRRRSCWAR